MNEQEKINEAEIKEGIEFLTSGKESGRVLSFSDYITESLAANEAVGYGEKPFFYAKNGDASNYFFKLDDQDSRSFVVTIGKFSMFAQPTEQKDNFAVLSITELTQEELDQAVVDKGEYKPNENKIELSDANLPKVLNQVAICVNDYLQKAPKTIKFYDEMQATMKVQDYTNKFAMSMNDWTGGVDTWHLQTIEKDKLNTVQK